MTDLSTSQSSSSRRAKRFLSPSEKYEIWVSLLRGEYTMAQAAERAGVDRSTISEGAQCRSPRGFGGVGAVQAWREGGQRAGSAAGRGQGRDRAALRSAEGDGRPVDAGRGKRALGLSGRVPRRVPAATKQELLRLVDEAVAGGWDHRRACRYLELREGRAWRWRELRAADALVDRRPGAALHGITPDEEAEILAVFEAFQDVDRSHRKLAHRGSYIQRVWVSASTVRRVLAAHDLRLRRPPRHGTVAAHAVPGVGELPQALDL